MTVAIADAEWDRAVAAIDRAVRDRSPVVLACHVDPDGDALGSMLALHLHLRRQGADSHASWGSAFQVPAQYTFLPGLDQLTPPDELPGDPALLVTFDSPGPSRLGPLAELIDRAGTVIVLDHHAGESARGSARYPAPKDFGDVRLVDHTAPATAAITEELLRRLGAEVDAELAACLYVGLVTDTGRFQYPTTDQATMELAGRLLATGIDPEDIGRRVFETHTFGYLKLLGEVLRRTRLEVDRRLLHTWLTEDDLSRCGVALEETESIIDLVRTVGGVDVVMVAKRLAESWKVSLRATDGRDVGAVADALGGGGHRHAAGLTWHGTYDELVAAVGEAIDAPLMEAG